MDRVDRNTLIVFVPGFSGLTGGARLRGYVTWAARKFLYEAQIDAEDPEQRAFAGYSGVRFTVHEAAGTRHVDVAEVDWEPGVKKLSTQSLVQRLWFGFLLLIVAAINGLRVAFESAGFAIFSICGVLLIAGWLFLVVTSVATGVDKALSSVLGKGAPAVAVLHDPRVAWLYLSVLAIVTVLAAFGVDADNGADIADVYDRYLHNRQMFGSYLRVRDALVQQVVDAVHATDDGKYGRVIVVGHSFGALSAAEAAASCGRPVELVTIGTFFNYLKGINGASIKHIMERMKAARGTVTRWYDFYSIRDFVAASKPFKAGVAAYVPRPVPLKMATIGDIVVLRSHLFYFEEAELMGELFRAPS